MIVLVLDSKYSWSNAGEQIVLTGTFEDERSFKAVTSDVDAILCLNDLFVPFAIELLDPVELPDGSVRFENFRSV